MPRIKDQAICIRWVDWSETSQVVTLVTEAHGKLSGVAKGSRRSSPSSVARFSGGIELLTLGQVVAQVKAAHELANITEWDLQETHPHLRADLGANRLGLYGADLTNAMLADHDAHPGTYQALRVFLGEVANEPARPRALVRFQWDVLLDCGYRPELEKDVISGDKLEAAPWYFFDPHAGGFTTVAPTEATANAKNRGSGRTSGRGVSGRGASGGASGGGGPWRVRKKTIEVMRAADGGEKMDVESFDAEALVRAGRLLCVYARAILDKELPTMAFVLGG